MNIQEAQEIMDKVASLQDQSCSCHRNPPCGKCENMPPPEDIAEAQMVLANAENQIPPPQLTEIEIVRKELADIREVVKGLCIFIDLVLVSSSNALEQADDSMCTIRFRAGLIKSVKGLRETKECREAIQ